MLEIMPLTQMSSTKTLTSFKIFGIPLTSLGNHLIGEKSTRQKGAILVDLEKEQSMKWACEMQDWTSHYFHNLSPQGNPLAFFFFSFIWGEGGMLSYDLRGHVTPT